MQKKFFKKAVVVAMSVMMIGSTLTAHAEDGVYTVKRGDNLSKIAKEVYGSKEEWKTIYEANKGVIKNANTLYAGQQLVLPGKSSGTTTDTSTETTTETTTDTSTETTTDTTTETTTEQTAVPTDAASGTLGVVQYDWDFNANKSFYREGIANVIISRTPSYGPAEYWEPYSPLPAAPAGYEWKEIDIAYVSDTIDNPISHYELAELNMEGLGQTVKSEEIPADWICTTNDDSWYDEYSFALNYNGTVYPECKYYERCIKDIEENLCMQIMLLLPKDYTGSVVYTAYGAKVVNGEMVKNEGESVSFVLQ